MVSEGIMGTTLPCIASHEGAGTVVKVGTSVKKFKVGDRVLCTLHYHRCGDCEDCTRPEGETQYCQKNKGALGITMDGFFAEYEVVDGRECCLLPDNLSFQSAAPLACAGLTAWGALVRANLKAGDRIAFVGAGGGVGAIGVQFAKALGLYVIGIDARDEGLALAEEMGADKIIDARFGKDKVVEEVRKVTEVKGVDVSLIVSDNELATSIGAAITRKHGKSSILMPTNLTPLC
jgi:propanol-preferring alcohol dehydrogenase